MTIASPKERPELYDNDIPMDRNLSQQYVDRVMPDHIKKRIAERRKQAEGKQQHKQAAE